MNRHYRLYIQGLESIERKREMAAHIEQEREDEELKDCAFQPCFLTTRPVTSSLTSSTPRLYAKYVERLRKGNAIKQSLNEMLRPRTPMKRFPNTLNPNDKAETNHVTVEVTKDGSDGSVHIVGRLSVNPSTDLNKAATTFAKKHALSAQQTKRLLLQLENTSKTYLN